MMRGIERDDVKQIIFFTRCTYSTWHVQGKGNNRGTIRGEPRGYVPFQLECEWSLKLIVRISRTESRSQDSGESGGFSETDADDDDVVTYPPCLPCTYLKTTKLKKISRSLRVKMKNPTRLRKGPTWLAFMLNENGISMLRHVLCPPGIDQNNDEAP